MGIPHLISTLEPYAALSSLAGEAVVIDGPALAYHVLNICRGNGLHYPGPDILGSTAVRWLDELTSRSVIIKAIYFDGFLPRSKEPVRMERMARNTSQLKQFFSSNPRGCPHQYFPKSDAPAVSLFEFGRLDGRFLVTPTFLVPAVTDALRQHPSYESLVHLVPAEADAFCAQHLAEHGGIVLTSDSDLLAHDLGNGRVVFLRDVHLDAHSQPVSATFDASEICMRLGLKSTDACRLAYERKQSPHSSLPQLVQACLQPLEDDENYHDFCQQYLHHETGVLPTSSSGNPLRLDQLDPRISELALRLGEIQEGSGRAYAELRMFLPVLLESHARGSAWEPSTSIRVLAYTIARWAVPGTQSLVLEYRRVQNVDQKGRQLTLLPKAVAESAVTDLVDIIRQLKSYRSGDKPGHVWLLLFLILDIRDRQDAEKESFVLRMLQSSASSFTTKRRQVPWDHVHLLAHLQAMWYSLRILSQVLQMLPTSLIESLSPKLGRLRQALSGFPVTNQCPELHQMLDWLSAAEQARTMETLGRFVNLPSTAPRLAGRKTATTKDEKDGLATTSNALAAADSSTASNKFSLLAVD